MPKMPPRSPNTRGRGLKPSAPSAGMDGAGPSSVSAGDPDVAGGRAGEANRRWSVNPRRRSAAFHPQRRQEFDDRGDHSRFFRNDHQTRHGHACLATGRVLFKL